MQTYYNPLQIVVNLFYFRLKSPPWNVCDYDFRWNLTVLKMQHVAFSDFLGDFEANCAHHSHWDKEEIGGARYSIHFLNEVKMIFSVKSDFVQWPRNISELGPAKYHGNTIKECFQICRVDLSRCTTSDTVFRACLGFVSKFL